jgi:hypothetical protein
MDCRDDVDEQSDEEKAVTEAIWVHGPLGGLVESARNIRGKMHTICVVFDSKNSGGLNGTTPDVQNLG